MIYVISDGEHYKIGYTAGEPRERLKTLQTGNQIGRASCRERVSSPV